MCPSVHNWALISGQSWPQAGLRILEAALAACAPLADDVQGALVASAKIVTLHDLSERHPLSFAVVLGS